MRKILALLIVAIATLTIIQSTAAADLTITDTNYSSIAYTSDHYGARGKGSSETAAVATAMRNCLAYTDDCTMGVAAPWDWKHMLVECPEVNLLTAAAFSPAQDEMIISDMVLAWLGQDYVNFKCVVIGGDYEGQPVLGWMITTH